SSAPNCSGWAATSSQNLAYQPGKDQLPMTVAGSSGRVLRRVLIRSTLRRAWGTSAPGSVKPAVTLVHGRARGYAKHRELGRPRLEATHGPPIHHGAPEGPGRRRTGFLEALLPPRRVPAVVRGLGRAPPGAVGPARPLGLVHLAGAGR